MIKIKYNDKNNMVKFVAVSPQDFIKLGLIYSKLPKSKLSESDNVPTGIDGIKICIHDLIDYLINGLEV